MGTYQPPGPQSVLTHKGTYQPPGPQSFMTHKGTYQPSQTSVFLDPQGNLPALPDLSLSDPRNDFIEKGHCIFYVGSVCSARTHLHHSLFYLHLFLNCILQLKWWHTKTHNKRNVQSTWQQLFNTFVHHTNKKVTLICTDCLVDRQTDTRLMASFPGQPG